VLGSSFPRLVVAAMGDLEEKVTTWIETITGELKGDQGFGDWLRDGQILCKLANTIQPGICPKVHTSTMPFKQMENLSTFGRACRELGVLEKDIFSTVDLYEQKNLKSVCLCLHNLGSVVRTTAPDFQGPYLGVAQSGASFDVARPKQTALRDDTGFRRDTDFQLRQGAMSLCKEHAAGSTLDPSTTGLRHQSLLIPPTTAAAGGTRGGSVPPLHSKGKQEALAAPVRVRAASPGSIFARESQSSWPVQPLARPQEAPAAPLRICGPLLKLSPHFLGGWQLRWFEVGGGTVRYYVSPDEAKAHAKPRGEVSVAGLRAQKTSDTAFNFTTLRTSNRTFSLDADVASKVASAGWELGPAGMPTAQQWVTALEHEAMAMIRRSMA